MKTYLMIVVALMAVAGLQSPVHATSLVGQKVAAEVFPGGIDTAKLARDSVTNAKIMTGAIDSRALASATIDTTKIAADSVVTSKILLNDLTALKIPCITTQKRLGTCSALKVATGVCDSCN